MSIEFKWLDKNNGSERVLLSESALQSIDSSVQLLRRKTGVFIDPYSDTRLSLAHVLILSDSIRKEFLDSSEIKALINMFDSAIKNSWWILVVGD